MESRKRRSRAELAEAYEQDCRFLLELWAILEPILQASALHNAALAPDEATAERLRQMAEVPFFDLMRRGLENVEGQAGRASRTGIRLGLQDSLESSRDFTPGFDDEFSTWYGSGGVMWDLEPSILVVRTNVGSNYFSMTVGITFFC